MGKNKLFVLLLVAFRVVFWCSVWWLLGVGTPISPKLHHVFV